MRVSVIITAYNLEDYVAQAVESALTQTYRPFEIIVVNDASTDGTDRVLRAFEHEIRYVSLPINLGGLRAYLTGLELAQGDVIAFLDGDDLWVPTKLEKCIAIFESSSETILVSHQHTRIDGSGKPLPVYDETHQNIDRVIRNFASPEERSREFKRSVLEKLGYWLGSAYTFRMDALDLGDFKKWVDALPNPQHVYLDLTLAPYLILANPTKQVALVDERLFRYRVHSNNSCNDYSDVERALRSVRRGYYTTLAADDLNQRFHEHPMAKAAHEAHQRALLYYSSLEALYSEKTIQATKVFLQLAAARHFSFRGLLKEAARLGIVWIGGVDLLLWLMTRRASRGTPADH